jgi:hypothetical protein
MARVPGSPSVDNAPAAQPIRHQFIKAVSHAATPAYEKMIRSFSPAEIRIMLDLPSGSSIVSNRIRSHAKCRSRFRELVSLIASGSVPTPARAAYDTWMREAR